LLLQDGSGAAAAAAEAGMRTALMGLVWPDADSACKATGVCRYFVGLAAGLVPALEPFVCNDLLKTALISLAQVGVKLNLPPRASCCLLVRGPILSLLNCLVLATYEHVANFCLQVFTADIQAEVLGLARVIMTTFLPRATGGSTVRRSVRELLQVQEGDLESFEKQLFTLGSENKQRGLIKQLVAQAGNEEVSHLLHMAVCTVMLQLLPSCFEVSLQWSLLACPSVVLELCR
jgi:hypothetical protein